MELTDSERIYIKNKAVSIIELSERIIQRYEYKVLVHREKGVYSDGYISLIKRELVVRKQIVQQLENIISESDIDYGKVVKVHNWYTENMEAIDDLYKNWPPSP